MWVCGKLLIQSQCLLFLLVSQRFIIYISSSCSLCLLLFLLSGLSCLLERHGELGEVALYVFLEEFCAELEVLHSVIIGEERVQVGDEVFSVEMHHFVVEVDLRKQLQVGVKVQRYVNDSGFIEELHQMWVIFEVCS